MTSLGTENLEKLTETGQLKKEPMDQAEFDGLVYSGRARLKDASQKTLALESSFDLAYNAAHALSLAALRHHGYRSDSRYLVFQCLPHTLGVGPDVWRLLVHCHGIRNRGEYEGIHDVDEQLITDLIKATEHVLESLEKLGSMP